MPHKNIVSTPHIFIVLFLSMLLPDRSRSIEIIVCFSTYQSPIPDALRCYILSNLMIILRSIAYIFGLLLFTISHNCFRWIMTKLWHLPKPMVWPYWHFYVVEKTMSWFFVDENPESEDTRKRRKKRSVMWCLRSHKKEGLQS